MGSSSSKIFRGEVTGITCSSLKPIRLKNQAKISHVPPFENQTRKVPCLFKHNMLPIHHCDNPRNEYEALAHRALTQTPVVDSLYADQFVNWSLKVFKKLIPIKRILPLNHLDYVKRSNARPSVKKVLKRTFTEMQRSGISSSRCVSNSTARKWTCRKAFIKVENLLYNYSGVVKDKAPRLIQGAQPQFINIVGPWITSLQDHFKKYWNKNNWICFSSGLTGVDIGLWASKAHSSWLENDISKFDSSICQKFMRLESKIFNLFQPPPLVRQLIKANIDTRGVTKHGIAYSVPGCRKSGDPYTSLGNSILNVLLHLFIASRGSTDISWLCRKIRMVAQGDDNALNHSLGYEPNWRDSFCRLGFEAECIKRNSVWDCDFCSSFFVPAFTDRIQPVLVPKPGRVLAKLGCFLDLPITVRPEQALRGAVLGLMASISYCPLLFSLFKNILIGTKHHKAWFKPRNDWDFLLNRRSVARFLPCQHLLERRYWGPLDQLVCGISLPPAAFRAMEVDSSAFKPTFK